MTRLQRFQTMLAQQQLPFYVVFNPKNVTYLSGFTGDESALVVTPDQAWLVTDSRYTAQAKQEVTQADIVLHTTGLTAKVVELAQELRVAAIGFESDYLTYVAYDALRQKMPERVALRATPGLIEQLREVKDEHEIAATRQAIKITDDCFHYILGWIKPGMTEHQVATEMEYFMRKSGASSSSFETIVASGYRSAWPHGAASSKVIATGELITLDFGCYYEGYTSDMTRTFAIGDPGTQAQEIYKIVYEANRAVIAVTRNGATGAQQDHAARDLITQAGYGPQFGHGTGHGIGLDIHEGPGAWGKYKDQPLVTGNIVTDEPGIYLEGLGGVRIEDDLLVTEDSCEVLTQSPAAELIIL